ncbi:hypothetical protein CCUG62472_00471 [Mycobacteroides salmoniphilum]|uniref:Uncharacterized protein n=1 Tax=Mycobacteroides salmoniphilum TaxID=404941 RepID=A0A4R8SW67_9MYCO|nr:hypothetical protein CCUG62472_00471 [Mycobacteroides salmoniphilum]TEA06592.1 hypothetical protein CCUG60884_01730 [Mycobacteroides salmoniphilum]
MMSAAEPTLTFLNPLPAQTFVACGSLVRTAAARTGLVSRKKRRTSLCGNSSRCDHGVDSLNSRRRGQAFISRTTRNLAAPESMRSYARGTSDSGMISFIERMPWR